MRLKEIAQRAFPNDKECAKQLRKRLMRTAPSSFLDRIEKREETKDMLELGKKLTWGEIVSLAEKEDKKRRKAAYYEQTEGSEPEMIDRLRRLKCSTATAGIKSSPNKVFTNSEFVGNPAKASNTFISCQWCGKPGHLEKKCWLKLGACTLCGSSEHKRLECLKYKRQRNSPNKPVCSECGGPHLGKDCHRVQRKIVLPSLITKKDGDLNC